MTNKITDIVVNVDDEMQQQLVLLAAMLSRSSFDTLHVMTTNLGVKAEKLHSRFSRLPFSVIWYEVQLALPT